MHRSANHVDLLIKVTDISKNGHIAHQLEVCACDDVFVTGYCTDYIGHSDYLYPFDLIRFLKIFLARPI
jgi:hypothetical protein